MGSQDLNDYRKYYMAADHRRDRLDERKEGIDHISQVIYTNVQTNVDISNSWSSRQHVQRHYLSSSHPYPETRDS